MKTLILFAVAALLTSCAGIKTSFKAGYVSPDTGINYGAKYTPRDRSTDGSKSYLDITAQK